jgi:hypothetical protein
MLALLPKKLYSNDVYKLCHDIAYTYITAHHFSEGLINYTETTG